MQKYLPFRERQKPQQLFGFLADCGQRKSRCFIGVPRRRVLRTGYYTKQFPPPFDVFKLEHHFWLTRYLEVDSKITWMYGLGIKLTAGKI
jgi:hypothetical protein